MSDPELRAVAAQVKKLTARMEALERLLERILRQKPVSEKQLERALRSRGLNSSRDWPLRAVSRRLGQGCVSPTWSNSEASSFSGAFTRVEIGHIVMGSDT